MSIATIDVEARKIEQREKARAWANEVRCANAATYQRIAALGIDESFKAVAAILRNPEGTQPAMRMGNLLQSAQSIGPTRATTLLRRAQVSGRDIHVRQLTDRQRLLIAGLLENPRRVWPSHGRTHR